MTWPLVYLASKSTTAVQAGVQRPRCRAADRPRTSRRHVPRREGGSAMAKNDRLTSTTRKSNAGRGAGPGTDVGTCPGTASSSGSTPAPARSRSSASASCGSRSAALIVAIAIASIVAARLHLRHRLRGRHQGVDARAATARRPNRSRTCSRKTLGKDPESVVVVGNGASATVQIRSETLTNAETEQAAHGAVRRVPAEGRRRPAEQAGRSATPRCRRPGAARSPRRR